MAIALTGGLAEKEMEDAMEARAKWMFALLVGSVIALVGICQGQSTGSCQPSFDFACVPTIAFVSTRDYPNAATYTDLFKAAEIYLMGPGPDLKTQRLTNNNFADGFPALSPDRMASGSYSIDREYSV